MKQLRGFKCEPDDFKKCALTLHDATNHESASSFGPGVYVWKTGSEILRVGRSVNNVLKRSLQHFLKSEKLGMRKYLNHHDVSVDLYLLMSEKGPYHSIFALEEFLEEKLQPIYPSGGRKHRQV